MAITLNDIHTEVRANVKSSLLALNRITLWANLAQEDLWWQLDPDFGKETATLTTANATRAYRFQASINKILSVTDQTNNLNLVQIQEKELERFDPDLDDAGTPNYYTLFGIDYVNNQPTAASFVTVSSSSAADTTQTVRILGTSSGVEATEQLTLSGVAAVVGATSFTALTRISKSATTTGRVTATSNAAAVTNVIIPPRRLFVEYQPIRLWPVPAGTYTILVRYIRNPIPMRNTDDIPDLPELYHGLLINAVMIYAHDHVYEFDRANQMRNIVAKQFNDMKASMTSQRGESLVIGRDRFRIAGIGRLPPEYPL